MVRKLNIKESIDNSMTVRDVLSNVNKKDSYLLIRDINTNKLLHYDGWPAPDDPIMDANVESINMKTANNLTLYIDTNKLRNSTNNKSDPEWDPYDAALYYFDKAYTDKQVENDLLKQHYDYDFILKVLNCLDNVYEDAENIGESLTENKTGKNAVWLDFRLEPEMKDQLKCADCEQTLNGRNCKSSLVHAVSAKWDRYDGMEWRCFCTRCYNGLKDEDPDEILDEFEPSTNYRY